MFSMERRAHLRPCWATERRASCFASLLIPDFAFRPRRLLEDAGAICPV